MLVEKLLVMSSSVQKNFRRSFFRFQIQLSSRVYRKPQTTNYRKTTGPRAVPEQAVVPIEYYGI